MQQFTTPPPANAPYAAFQDYSTPPAFNAPALGLPLPGGVGGLPANPGLQMNTNPLPPALQSGAQRSVPLTPTTPPPFASYPQEMPMAGLQQPQQAMQGGQRDTRSMYPMRFAEGGTADTADAISDMGRYGDSVLVHMSPEEVNSLQGLAQLNGTSMTINPHTGMPEAFKLGRFLKKLAPTLIGGALAATGVGAPLAAAMVGLGSTALTGSLKKGLMAGLSAYGGASLAGAAGLGGSISNNAFGALSNKAGFFGAEMGAGLSAAPGTSGAAAATGAATPPTAPAVTPPPAIPGIEQGPLPMTKIPMPTVNNPVLTAADATKQGIFGKFGTNFAEASRSGLPGGTPEFVSKAAPMLAASGLLSGVSGALSPGSRDPGTGAIDNSYEGPYFAQRRTASFAPSTEDVISSSKQRRYYDVDMPEIYNVSGDLVVPGSSTERGALIRQPFLNPKAKKNQNMYSYRNVPFGMSQEEYNRLVSGQFEGLAPFYAEGGEVHMDDGAFVVDARTVSELGNGSSNAGIDLLRRVGGQPVQGPGDGVSDSVHARIGGAQEARVARDEVIIPAQAVKRLGGGNPKRGTDKLYAMMDKAHRARKSAKRGQDTNLRRGLA